MKKKCDFQQVIHNLPNLRKKRSVKLEGIASNVPGLWKKLKFNKLAKFWKKSFKILSNLMAKLVFFIQSKKLEGHCIDTNTKYATKNRSDDLL